MTTPNLRRMAVAGSWYPADARALAEEVDRYLAAASPAVADDPGDSLAPLAPLAIIAPHAGLLYSGPVAAHAYRLLAGRTVEVAVLVGPSHFVGFEGVAIYDHGAFETPFGPMRIDEACASAIALGSSGVREHPAAHVREHSLEMQLPFLARVLPDVSIVPLVMGFQRRDTVYALADALATALKGRRGLLVASSDLSHYQTAATAATLDGKVIRHVEQFDPDGLMSTLERFPEHACGGGPMVSVMLAARALGARDARVLNYGDSGDISGDQDAVVGYMAAVLGNSR
jgi:AmmeMemoRadiSam system protein B